MVCVQQTSCYCICLSPFSNMNILRAFKPHYLYKHTDTFKTLGSNGYLKSCILQINCAFKTYKFQIVFKNKSTLILKQYSRQFVDDAGLDFVLFLSFVLFYNRNFGCFSLYYNYQETINLLFSCSSFCR